MLELPDVAELVDEQVVVRLDGTAKQDQPPRGVAVEAPEPGQPEERGEDDDPHAVDPDRLRVPVEPVESCLRLFEPAYGTGSRRK